MAAVTTFAVALGIVVDDTVHIMWKYRVYRTRGGTGRESVVYSLNNSVVAIGITSFVLAVGFLFQSLSHFELSATQGAMVSATILVALILDLFYFVPILWLMHDRLLSATR